MKNLQLRFFCALCSIFFVVVGRAEYSELVPFKMPTSSRAEFMKELNDENSNVVVISGAGLSGELAGNAIAQTKLYSHVIIVETRDVFSRSNTLSIRKQALTRFNELKLLDAFKNTAIFSRKWSFRSISPLGEVETITSEYADNLLPVDFSKPVKDVFAIDADSHFAVEIAQMQRMLADEGNKLPEVYLLPGTIDVVMNSSGRHGVVIHMGPDDIVIDRPRLVIIAEGTKSQTREKIGIKFLPVDRVSEHWCSGVVSLENIIEKVHLVGDISLVRDKQLGMGGFGVVRPKRHDMFINSLFREEDQDNTSKCIERAARVLLHNRRHELTMALDESQPIVVLNELSAPVQVIFNKADKAYVGRNTVLLGDAHRSGSPIGGLGFSLIATVENVAITELSRAMFDEANLDMALSNYQHRLNEIADFWHTSSLP